MKVRKVITCTLALISTSLLAACSAGSTATHVGREPGSGIVVAATAAPASLDFTSTGGAAIPQALMGNVYETLVTIGEDGEILPALATSWDVSDDGLTYTFRLREGVDFSNGDEFTADTAAFSITNVQNNWTNGLKSQMAAVASARAVDTHLVEVTLSTPSNRWLWSMATLTGAMMTPGGMDQLATNPVGTGPYTVSRFVAGSSVSYAARDDYWGEKPQSDATIRYYSDATGSVNALRTGDVDVVYGMQAPELLDTLPEDYGVEVGTTNGEVLLSMNNSAAPFDDVRVRRAVTHAIDRQAVNDIVYAGLAVDTGGAPVPPTDPWFTGEDYAPYDPDLARELLAEAGYSDSDRPELTITIPSLPYTQKLSELVYSQLVDVGFNVKLETAEFPAVWLSQVMAAGDYQMSVVAHVEPRDIPTLFGNPDGYLKFDNQEVRDDLAAADSSATPEEQTQDMEAAVAKIMDDAGALTLVNAPNIVLTAPGVSGVKATVITDSLKLSTITRAEK